MKTMSDFIMEQDVVTAPAEDVTDVEIMESFMKMNAVASVVDCYIEHAAIAAFAESENLNVFTESGDDVKEKKNGGIKKWLQSIWTWLKNLVRSVVQFVTGNHLDHCIEKLKALLSNPKSGINESDTFEAADFTFTDDIMDDINTFISFFETGAGDAYVAKDVVQQKINDWKSKEADKDKKANITYGELLAKLEEIKKNNWATKSKEILKKIDIKSKEELKVPKNDDEDAKLVNDKELMKLVKEATKILAKKYDKYTQSVAKLTDKLLKTKIKDMDKAKKEKEEKEKKAKQESAEVDTEGYNFL